MPPTIVFVRCATRVKTFASLFLQSHIAHWTRGNPECSIRTRPNPYYSKGLASWKFQSHCKPSSSFGRFLLAELEHSIGSSFWAQPEPKTHELSLNTPKLDSAQLIYSPTCRISCLTTHKVLHKFYDEKKVPLNFYPSQRGTRDRLKLIFFLKSWEGMENKKRECVTREIMQQYNFFPLISFTKRIFKSHL